MAQRRWQLYGIALAALLAFVWLGRAAMLGQTLPFDLWIREAVHAWASPPMTVLMKALTQFGAPLVLVPVTVVAGWRLAAAGLRRQAVLLALSTIGAAAAEESLKLIFHRMRPAAFFGYDEPLTYSYPSGHATTSICFYGVLLLILAGRAKSPARRRTLQMVALLLVLIIGFSRVYLGVHYPTDVLGGWAFGVAWIIGVLHADPAIAGKWLRPSSPT